jgi:hypothetical protein
MITLTTSGLLYIISTMTMSYDATNEVYTLNKIDAKEIEKFVIKRNVLGSCTRFVHGKFSDDTPYEQANKCCHG